MAVRSQKEIRQRAPWWLIGLLVFNFALMTYDARDQVTNQRLIRVWAQAIASPAQTITSGIGGLGLGVWDYLAHLRGAAQENEQLRQRMAEMETELRDARATRDENDRLRGLLGFQQDGTYQVVPARVIARDPSAWFDSVIINRGSSSGVNLNMPVVTPGGIVGRVTAVSPWTAQVTLITDERAAAGAVVGQLGTSNALGSVRGLGRGTGLLEMRYVSGMEEVNVGDYVVTTGQDEIYPPGVNVGEVVEVRKGSATESHTIYVKPGARLDSLQEVAVLIYQPPPRGAMERTLPNADRGRR